MSKGGVLQYKCRRCGAIDESIHVPDIEIAISYTTLGIPTPKLWGATSIRMVDVHCCDDGGRGVTDLIGGIFDR